MFKNKDLEQLFEQICSNNYLIAKYSMVSKPDEFLETFLAFQTGIPCDVAKRITVENIALREVSSKLFGFEHYAFSFQPLNEANFESTMKDLTSLELQSDVIYSSIMIAFLTETRMTREFLSYQLTRSKRFLPKVVLNHCLKVMSRRDTTEMFAALIGISNMLDLLTETGNIKLSACPKNFPDAYVIAAISNGLIQTLAEYIDNYSVEDFFLLSYCSVEIKKETHLTISYLIERIGRHLSDNSQLLELIIKIGNLDLFLRAAEVVGWDESSISTVYINLYEIKCPSVIEHMIASGYRIKIWMTNFGNTKTSDLYYDEIARNCTRPIIEYLTRTDIDEKMLETLCFHSVHTFSEDMCRYFFESHEELFMRHAAKHLKQKEMEYIVRKKE